MAIVNGNFVPDNFNQGNNQMSNGNQMNHGTQLGAQTDRQGPKQGIVTPSNPMSSPSYANNIAMSTSNPSYQNNLNNKPNYQLHTQPFNFNQPPTVIQQTGQQMQPRGFQQYQQQPQQQYQQMPQYQPPPKSIEQTVQNGNPQSVQNFLTALNQVGAGSNNTFMNYQGQQGQQAQAGFQGFGFNGYQAGPQAAMYSGPMQSQLGYTNNMATSNYGPQYQNNGASNGSMYGGGGQYAGNINGNGQGGISGAPNYDASVTKKQLGETNNIPRYNDSLYSGDGNNGKPLFDPNINNNTPYGIDASGKPIVPNGIGPDGKPIYIDPVTGKPWDSSIGADKPGIATSDINSKTNITGGKSELEDFLNSLGTYSYEYKNKEYGDGRRISPMAQEIESTPLGKIAISTNKEGYKQVDYGKLAGTQLAALAMLNNKYNEMDKKMKLIISSNISAKKRVK